MLHSNRKISCILSILLISLSNQALATSNMISILKKAAITTFSASVAASFLYKYDTAQKIQSRENDAFSFQDRREDGLKKIRRFIEHNTVKEESYIALESLEAALHATLNMLRVHHMMNLETGQYGWSQQIRHARTEYISHLPYKLDRISPEDLAKIPGIPILNKCGAIELFHVERIDSGHPGICGFLLTPVNPDNPEIIISFEGTQNSASQWRDVEGLTWLQNNPGYLSMATARQKIVNFLHERLDVIRSPRQMIFAGHSLGGADAQQVASAYLEFLHQENKHHHIESVWVCVSNSAGIPDRIACASSEHANLALSENPDLQLSFTGILVDGDGVQLSGEGHLWTNCIHDRCQFEVFKIHYFSSQNTRTDQICTIEALLCASSVLFAPWSTTALHISHVTTLLLRKTATSHRIKYYAHACSLQLETFAHVNYLVASKAQEELRTKFSTIGLMSFLRPLLYIQEQQEPKNEHDADPLPRIQSSQLEWEILRDPWST